MGIMALRDLPRLVSPIWLQSSMQRPTGGVTRPMQRLKLITMPKARGLILKAVSSGVRIGVIMMMAALASISIPMIRNSRFSKSRITYLLSVMAVKALISI